ncbi:AI-2E family transporter [Tsuneonella mangrovi]|uniref:AI-2E family transporter n=1 Tax=Tsuneonella mangrovi TaxID=1982042 RepID=UPI000BA2265D|nr:AI-2E family transporter [Tsuneonella mangrovi]
MDHTDGGSGPGEPQAERSRPGIGASPSRIASRRMRYEAGRALAWGAVIGLIALSIYLAQSLLVIFGALVFASMIDGGARLIGKVVPIGRGWRVAMVLILTVAFLAWLVIFAGSQISQQAAQFPQIVSAQADKFIALLRAHGFDISQTQVQSVIGSVASGVGTLSRAIGGAVGAIATTVLILIIGIYLALDPRAYERGVEWMVPEERREAFSDTLSHMAYNMRRLLAGRLLGMVVEGVFTYVLLSIIGVPMAALLGIITGLLAFIPNIGAIISGLLMVLVGFSGGTEMGLWTLATYFFVQNFDGYIVVPMIAKKTVDLAPALVLGFQLIMGVLFGVLGLMLADPMLAMIKVALERRAHRFDVADMTRSSRKAAG